MAPIAITGSALNVSCTLLTHEVHLYYIMHLMLSRLDGQATYVCLSIRVAEAYRQFRSRSAFRMLQLHSFATKAAPSPRAPIIQPVVITNLLYSFECRLN
jgi:hypothetical protein